MRDRRKKRFFAKSKMIYGGTGLRKEKRKNDSEGQ